MNYNKINYEEIRNRLLSLNEERGVDEVAGFWVEMGDVQGEWHANVVYIMQELEHNSKGWPLEEVDSLCEIVSERLGDLVSYTYCWFRTQDEFEKEFSDEIKLKKVS